MRSGRAALAWTGLAMAAVAVACGPTSAPTVTTGRSADAGGSGGVSAGSGVYAGRAIAPTMSYLGADWLDRADRADREQPDRVLDALAITPGMTVADVGAGTGYFTLRLAARVGERGKVYATDLQPEMLRVLGERARAAGLRNVELVRAGDRDAALPPDSVDLVLLVDVYHELADPAAIMAGVRRALRPHGRLVLVEYRAEDPRVPIKPEHEMTLPQIQRELTGLGFRFVQSLEFLPDQRVVVFE